MCLDYGNTYRLLRVVTHSFRKNWGEKRNFKKNVVSIRLSDRQHSKDTCKV